MTSPFDDDEKIAALKNIPVPAPYTMEEFCKEATKKKDVFYWEAKSKVNEYLNDALSGDIHPSVWPRYKHIIEEREKQVEETKEELKRDDLDFITQCRYKIRLKEENIKNETRRRINRAVKTDVTPRWFAWYEDAQTTRKRQIDDMEYLGDPDELAEATPAPEPEHIPKTKTWDIQVSRVFVRDFENSSMEFGKEVQIKFPNSTVISKKDWPHGDWGKVLKGIHPKLQEHDVIYNSKHGVWGIMNPNFKPFKEANIPFGRIETDGWNSWVIYPARDQLDSTRVEEMIVRYFQGDQMLGEAIHYLTNKCLEYQRAGAIPPWKSNPYLYNNIPVRECKRVTKATEAQFTRLFKRAEKIERENKKRRLDPENR